MGEPPDTFTTSHRGEKLAKHRLGGVGGVVQCIKIKNLLEKTFCKHGTINRSNSRFCTMHVMTLFFLWYNVHTSLAPVAVCHFLIFFF